MAESSLFWTTDGTGDGASSYTADDMRAFFSRMFQRDTTSEGVIAGWANELAVSGTSSPVSVATGAGMVAGIPYENTSTVTVTVPTPSTSTRIDRIVLRADYSAQTVRIVRSAGVEGGSAPSLTQSAGVTWEVSLAQVAITTGGVITVTDEREFCRYGSGFLRARTGASDSSWDTATGLNVTQVVNSPNMQAGANYWTVTAAASGTVTLTFPVAFDDAPLVIATVADTTSSTPTVIHINESNVTASGATFEWFTTGGGNITTIVINWIALGPMS